MIFPDLLPSWYCASAFDYIFLKICSSSLPTFYWQVQLDRLLCVHWCLSLGCTPACYGPDRCCGESIQSLSECDRVAPDAFIMSPSSAHYAFYIINDSTYERLSTFFALIASLTTWLPLTHDTCDRRRIAAICGVRFAINRASNILMEPKNTENLSSPKLCSVALSNCFSLHYNKLNIHVAH